MADLTLAEILLLMRGLHLMDETRALSDDDRQLANALAFKLGTLTADLMLDGSGIMKTAPDVPRP